MKNRLSIYLYVDWIGTLSENEDKTCTLTGQLGDGITFNDAFKAMEYILKQLGSDLTEYELIWREE